MRKVIYCCSCEHDVDARLTDGTEIYPHRHDLHDLPFWICPNCCNYVGCHHKTSNRTKPLGNIPSPELRNARTHIHKILDPIWKTGKKSRAHVYQDLNHELGYEYHTAEIRSIEEARHVYRTIKRIFYK